MCRKSLKTVLCLKPAHKQQLGIFEIQQIIDSFKAFKCHLDEQVFPPCCPIGRRVRPFCNDASYYDNLDSNESDRSNSRTGESKNSQSKRSSSKTEARTSYQDEEDEYPIWFQILNEIFSLILNILISLA